MNRKIIFLLFVFLTIQLVNSSFYAQQNSVKSIDGVDISYAVKGAGNTALVFIHGWSCDKSYWNILSAELAENFEVVTIDLAGHGESGLNRENYTIELFGEDVSAVVNHLKLDKVILIGHSMGGAVIIEAAKRLPGKVIGLIGVDTYQSLKDDWTAEQKEGFLKPFGEDFVNYTKGFVKSMFPQTADTNLIKKIADDMSSAPPKVAISAIRNTFFYDPIPTLQEINPPVVSINCDLYPIAAEENKKYFSYYEVKYMKGTGHFLMFERPDEFSKLVLEAANELINK